MVLDPSIIIGQLVPACPPFVDLSATDIYSRASAVIIPFVVFAIAIIMHCTLSADCSWKNY